MPNPPRKAKLRSRSLVKVDLPKPLKFPYRIGGNPTRLVLGPIGNAHGKGYAMSALCKSPQSRAKLARKSGPPGPLRGRHNYLSHRQKLFKEFMATHSLEVVTDDLLKRWGRLIQRHNVRSFRKKSAPKKGHQRS